MRRLLCWLGIHVEVIEGGGMFNDLYTCTTCGREKYPEVFGVALKVRLAADEKKTLS